MRRTPSKSGSDFSEDGDLFLNDPGSPRSPWTSHPVPENYEDAKQVHSQRSQRAQTLDEQRNAPIPDEYETWRDNPGRTDWPQVDTVSQEVAGGRSERFVEEIENRGYGTYKSASLPLGHAGGTARSVEEDTPPARMFVDESGHALSPLFASGWVEHTEAHEGGHVVDIAAGGDVEPAGPKAAETIADIAPMDEEHVGTSQAMSKDGLFEDDELRAQALDLSRRMIGAIKDPGYREADSELMAATISSAVLEPGAADREAPDLVDAVDQVLTDRLDVGLDELRG